MTNRRSHWQHYKLGELVQSVDYGLTASATNAPVGPKFLRITDIQNGSVNWDSVPFCKYDGKETERFTLASGDIVFARTGATTGKSFRVTECPDKAVYASYLIRVRPGRKVDSAYLARFFQTPEYWRQITKNSTGTAQAGVNATNLKSLVVPLPPLSEQKRIAAILDKADALREKRRQIIARFDPLLQSVFLDMFGDPATNPKGWDVVEMQKLFAISPNFGTMIPPQESGEWLSLRVGNIQNWNLDLSDSKYVDLPANCIERHTVQDGDLLMARAIASQEHLGKCIIVYPNGRKWAFDSHLMRLRLDRNIASPEYIRRSLMTPGGRSLFLRKTRKSTVQYNINTKEIAQIQLPLAPISLQKTFERLTKRVSELKVKHVEALSLSDNLFHSLQQRAFSGELFSDTPELIEVN